MDNPKRAFSFNYIPDDTTKVASKLEQILFFLNFKAI